jgi:predicted TIM-barrel fold metal-dependent hydrolase
MFAADCPFEQIERGGHWMDKGALDDKVRADIASASAARYFDLDQARTTTS